MNPSETTAAKAWAVAIVALVVFVAHAVISGDWTDTQSVTTAIMGALLSIVTWVVPNKSKG